MKSKLIPTALYLGDNGRCFCGAHAGATAQASGQNVQRVTERDQQYFERRLYKRMECETCRAQKVAA